MYENAKAYAVAIKEAMLANKEHTINGLYTGKSGVFRLAREFGYGLNDFSSLDDIREYWGDLYQILVIETYGKQIVGKRQFLAEIKSQLDFSKLQPAITLDQAKSLEYGTELFYRW